MSGYAEGLLADGEQIVLRSRQHWLSTIVDGRLPWALLVVGLVLLFLSQQVGDPLRSWVGWADLVLIVVAIAWLVRIYWSWLSQDYLVTNRRVIKVDGIVNKHTADSSLEKINDAVLDQNVFGRMFNYGDLDILTAQDTAIDRYRMLDAAPRFKREMLNQKALLEQEVTRPILPSPPLRAAAAPAPNAAVPDQARPGAPAPSPRAMTPEEVTRTLASLADLRDRGAVSAEEYEAKKADLLARL